ncbi:MMPL family transporter [Candidatus Bipolaricaulota bacterium]|nr:MMPL family transporter [Candidatus Bipolaricaulota bacterium]
MSSFDEWVVDNPWKVIGLALIGTVVLGFFIPGLNLVTNFEEYLSSSNPAVEAMTKAEERYGSQTFVRVTMVTEDTVFDEGVLKRLEELRKEIAGLSGVKRVEGPLNSQMIIGQGDSLVVEKVAPEGIPPNSQEELENYRERLMGNELLVGRVVSESGKSAALSIEMERGVNQQEVADEIRAITDAYNGPEEIYIAGLPFMNSVLSEEIMNDLVVLLPLVFVAIGIVLYLSFRSPRGILLPLTVVTLSTIWSVGLMALAGVPFTLITFILPVILVAVGTAYSIHVLNKYYELSGKDMPKREIIVKTASAMYSPVSMAGLTTAAGFLALLSSFLVPQRQFGIFAAIGVFFSIIFSLTLVPAILSLLPLQKKNSDGGKSIFSSLAEKRESFLKSFERLVASNKKTLLGAFLVVLAVFAAGTFLVRIETSQRSFLGEGSVVTRGLNSLDRSFSGSNQLLVEIDTGRKDGLKDPDTLRKMEEFENWLKTKEGIKINKTFSLVDIVKQLNQEYHGGDPAYFRIPEKENLASQLLLLFSFQGGGLGQLARGDFSAGEITGLYDSAPSSDIVQLKKEVQKYLNEQFSSIDAEMVGSTRLSAMVSSKVVSSQLVSLVTSIGVAGAIVALITGSAVAGIISLIPLVLTVLINFGVMGYSGTPLDLATLMVSSIVIGIGIDYAIHFIERFRIEYERDRDEEEILSATLRTTGQGIFYNAMALAVGFAILAFSSFSAIVNFGFLMALTMIVSMISAFTVIPAILLLFRPSFLEKKKD